MECRLATYSDIQVIMACIHDAQALLRECDVDQWQDGYPTAEIIAEDISRGDSFVITEGNDILATAVICFSGEPTYKIIRGKWLNDEKYAVIHRLAVRKEARGTGLAKRLFAFAEQLCSEHNIGNIRVDTHRDNAIMQQLLHSLGYTLCGEITLTSGATRIALHKVL